MTFKFCDSIGNLESWILIEKRDVKSRGMRSGGQVDRIKKNLDAVITPRTWFGVDLSCFIFVHTTSKIRTLTMRMK